MHATVPRLVWLDAGRGFVRDSSGRFDVMFSERLRMWVAIDWDNGKKTRHLSIEAARGQCISDVSDEYMRCKEAA